jgi:hypothetical protein
MAAPVTLPVGFEEFHPKGFVSHQFNRAHALGYARPAAAAPQRPGRMAAISAT